MNTQAPLVLCSGSLGSAPLEEKLVAAADAGFGWVSIYGGEYRAASEAGVDVASLLNRLGLRVAEVDGVAVSLRAPELFAEAMDIAVATSARSITIVETGAFDPSDNAQMREAVAAFGEACDVAAERGVLVHIEPFAWSSLARSADAARIVELAGRENGGLLLDLWHHVRGPDQGVLDASIPPAMLLGIQLADVAPEPWPNVRDECMEHRLLPGEGHGALAGRLADLADRGPLPPVGVEVFGAALSALGPAGAAAAARRSLESTLKAAGLTDHEDWSVR